jgi:hypothetical protein
MRRGAVYYFRCKIPADLIDHYDKREIVESLRTNNATEALRKVRKRSEAQEQQFDRVRAGKGVSELSAEVNEDLATRWAAGVLSEDEVNRIDGTMKAKHVLGEDIGGLHQIEAGLRDSLARGDFALVELTADDTLHEAGITLDKNSESYRKLCFRILKQASFWLSR